MLPISRTGNCLRNGAKQKSHFCFAMRKIPRMEFFEVPFYWKSLFKLFLPCQHPFARLPGLSKPIVETNSTTQAKMALLPAAKSSGIVALDKTALGVFLVELMI